MDWQLLSRSNKSTRLESFSRAKLNQEKDLSADATLEESPTKIAYIAPKSRSTMFKILIGSCLALHTMNSTKGDRMISKMSSQKLKIAFRRQLRA